MNEIAKRPVIMTGIVRRIVASFAYIAALVVMFVPLRVLAITTSTVTETFEGITCPSTWQSDPKGLNSSSYINCSNGWVAYALDSFQPGNIGNQNQVSVDTLSEGPPIPNPLDPTGPDYPNPPPASAGVVEMNTAPGDTPRGEVRFYKTFPVQPGVPIRAIQAEMRIKMDGTSPQYYGINVYDGVQTFNTGASPVLSSVRFRDGSVTSSSDACFGVDPGDWCVWQVTPNLGGDYVVPTSSYITVVFYIADTRNDQQLFGEIDNLIVSDVVTAVDSPLLPKEQAIVWNRPFFASGTDNRAEASDIVTDGVGNTYVTGRTYNGLNYDMVTIKYDSSGVLQWTKIHNSSQLSGDEGVAIALGQNGTYVYVLEKSYTPSSNGHDFVLLVYNASDGSVAWGARYDNSGQDDVPTGLFVNDNDGVYLTGYTCADPADAASCDYLTVKYDIGGTFQWANTYAGPAGGSDKAVGITYSGGSVYVSGTSAGSSDDIVTVKYNASTGSQQKVERYDSGWNDRATAIKSDSAGNTYVTGFTYSGGSPSILVLKYDTNDNLLWTTKYAGAQEALPSAMYIDNSGNVYITGKVGRVFDHDILALKVLSSGSIAWARTLGNAGFDDWGVDIAVSNSGSVYVLGALTKNSAGNTDFIIGKYDSNGNPLSAITRDNGAGLIDTPAAMSLYYDTAGDARVNVTGTSFDRNGLSQMLIQSYEKTTPDLTVTAVSGPASAFIGNTININDTVLNIANLTAKQYGESGPFDVGLYLAPGGSGAPDLNNAIFLGFRSISNLTPGNVNEATTAVTIPTHNPVTNALVLGGTYYIVVKADNYGETLNNNGVVSEKDEVNNIMSSVSTIAISGTLPDLAITKLSSSSTTIVRSDSPQITIPNTVTNLASTPVTGSFHVGFYLSTDQTIDTGDILIGERTINGLGGFMSDTDDNTKSFTLDSSLIPNPGTYYLGAIVDDQNDVQEIKENNNTAILNGTSKNTLLVSDKDFIPGLNVSGSSHAQVSGTGNSAHVMIEEQNAVWSRQSAWDPPDIGGYAAPLLADLDGDGLPDLLIGSSSGYIYGYKNNGNLDNPWTPMPAWNIPPSGACSGGLAGYQGQQNYSKPAIGDMNGDGIPDILLIGYDYGICAYRNDDGTGNPTVPPTWVQNPSWDVPNVANASTTPPNVVPPSIAGTHNAPTLVDVDGDGLLDLFVGQDNSTVVYAYKNTGTNTAPIWSYHQAWDYNGAPTYAAPRLVDFNHDGRIDYMMIGDRSGIVSAIKNNGAFHSDPSWASSSDSAWDFTTVVGGYASPAFADIDGDGRIDMLVGVRTGPSYALLNTGSFYANAAAPAFDGTYLSPVIDSGTHGQFTSLSYVTSLPTGTSISVDIRSSTDGINFPNPWLQGIMPDGPIGSLGSDRYIQYRVNMSTSDGNVSPALYSIEADSLPAAGTPNTVSVQIGTSSSSSGGGELSLYELMLLSLAIGLCGRRRWKNSPYV